MTDSILDEVQALLDKEVGDKRILEQIQRAAINNEVISNFERNYVRKLAEKHLGKKPPVEIKPEEQKVIPDVEMATQPSPQPQTIQTFSPPPTVSKSNSKNTKIILIAGIAALVVIFGAAAIFVNFSDISQNTDITKNPTSQTFEIQTDVPAYKRGDIISISGNSKLKSGELVNLTIKNPDGEIVWEEQVSIKVDGRFTTLTFAGGSGWDSGKYEISAEANSEQTSDTFTYSQ